MEKRHDEIVIVGLRQEKPRPETRLGRTLPRHASMCYIEKHWSRCLRDINSPRTRKKKIKKRERKKFHWPVTYLLLSRANFNLEFESYEIYYK